MITRNRFAKRKTEVTAVRLDDEYRCKGLLENGII